jgi:hypothetical protein
LSCSGDAATNDPTHGSVGSTTEGGTTEGSSGVVDDGDSGNDDAPPGPTSGAAEDDGTDANDSSAAESSDGAGTSGGEAPKSALWIADAIYAPDMTPDGTTVLMGDEDEAVFRWTDVDGLGDAVTTAPLGVNAISQDATRIAGTVEDADGKQTAAIWDDGIGWTSLGGFDSCDAFRSSGYDMSADGSVVVGLAWEGCSGIGFRWEDAEMSVLTVLEQGNNRASAISRDGEVAAGFAQTLSRSPALWWADGTSLAPDPEVLGEFHAISDDGDLAAGTSLQQAMYWTEDEGFVILGHLGVLGDFDHARILGVCNEGELLIGTQAAMFGSGTAIVWTADGGLREFADLLAEYHVDVPAEVVRFERAVSCSADGTRIAGTLIHATAGLQTFVVDLIDRVAPPR